VKRGSEVSGNEKTAFCSDELQRAPQLLVQRREVWDMAEFFVLRGHRRRGIGTQIAHQLWTRFTGPWEVRMMRLNVAACQFWARAISTFTGEVIYPVRVEKGASCWKLFSFESKRVS
jgi:predicted acetyltransferase